MNKIDKTKSVDAGLDFIQLNRTFHELPEYVHEFDDIDLSLSFYGKQFYWSDLVDEYRLVILAEAGSGKTTEIRNLAHRLRAEGKSAFFLRLEHISTELAIAFEVGTEVEFCDWMADNEEGWLLLDSVDEARLKSPQDFELAIRKVSYAINSAIDRTHIIITSRTTAWRPNTDLRLCQQHLRSPALTKPEQAGKETSSDDQEAKNSKESSGLKGFKLVTLDNLGQEQIEIFIAARGITNTKAFLDAVERADAWTFTTRPQDLEDLIAFWLDTGRIGNRLEVMQNSIKRRLIERDQGRAETRPISLSRIREGARLLAAAATLSKNPTIRIPDGSDNHQGISVQNILTDWNEAEQSTLLSRPIFDEAIYGTVRFHHRSVREYLTAEWFSELLKCETSRRQIERLFFREQYGRTIITPTLRPILPWLCVLDNKIRARALDIAPEIALEGGDPSQWPLDERRRILQDICQQITNGITGRNTQDYNAIKRFAQEDLTADVRALLNEYITNNHLCTFLLRMIWQGEMTEALPEVLQIALSNEAQEDQRIAAFRALNIIARPEDRRAVRNSFLDEAIELNRELLAELLDSEQPNVETIKWIIAALEKCQPKAKFSVDHLSYNLLEFIKRTPEEMLPNLVKAFNAFLNQPPVIERIDSNVSEKFEWLLTSSISAIERLAASRNPAALMPESLDIINKFVAAKSYRSEVLLKDDSHLSEIVSVWPELNRSLFWFEVETARTCLSRKSKERLTDHWSASPLRRLWRFDYSDFDYVVEQISSQSTQDNKLVALSLAFDIYRNNSRPRQWREKLKKLTRDNTELSSNLNNMLHPPANRTMRSWKAQERRWEKHRESLQLKKEQDLVKSKAYLTENIESLRTQIYKNPDQLISPVMYLYNHLRDDLSGSNRYAQYNWQKLTTIFGEDVAHFYRDAAVSFGRHYVPIMHSEGMPFNKTPHGAIIGLVGLEIESHETAGWPNGLTEKEVEIACKFASFELNGFPKWFPKLFSVYPDAVSRFLLKEIQYELSIETPENKHHYILDDVSWAGEWAWESLASDIFKILQEYEPVNHSNLNMLLKIMQESSLLDTQIATLATDKCTTLCDSAHLARWFAVWTNVDPDKAIPVLQERLVAFDNVQKATDFSMSYITQLLGERHRKEKSVRTGFDSAIHLKTLYLLMCKYIRYEDDIERAGTGVYSPDLRDNAQIARGTLLERLRELSGKDVYLALSEIAAANPQHPWFASFAKEKAETDGDLKVMTSSEVRELHDKHERTPTDHRELAELALLRLQDLKDDLENGDNSLAKTWIRIENETEMRNNIGRELREKARGRYNISHEDELADAKKPDFRFLGVGFDAPVPIELKIADKWSGMALFERMENQLCGDYLRDSRSNRGIYVLVNRGHKQTWKLPDNEGDVSFEVLTAALQKSWNNLSLRFPNIEQVDVIGINLTLRNSSNSRNK